jgi:hypothetical protein
LNPRFFAVKKRCFSLNPYARDHPMRPTGAPEAGPSYWHFALHALVAAFFPQAWTAAASFFALPAEGVLAESMQDVPEPEQLCIPSSEDLQSESFSHAASCLAHVLSTHLPQSVLLNEGDGGGVAAAGAGASAVALAAGASAGADEDAAEAADSLEAVSAALEDALVSFSGLSAGLLSPPHANHARGTVRVRASVAAERRLARLMVSIA